MIPAKSYHGSCALPRVRPLAKHPIWRSGSHRHNSVPCPGSSLDERISDHGRCLVLSLQDFRQGKPGFYPDQCVYAEYACSAEGLAFESSEGGLLFWVTSRRTGRSVVFGGGRCSYFPQNSATAATLAADKYLCAGILERAGVRTLGGAYFFLHDRHRALRPPGHERDDAVAYLLRLGGNAFAKPLFGSRGDFAQAIVGEPSLRRFMDEVARYHDSILLQPMATGLEYRVFLLDGEVVYSARKRPPSVVGDGVHTLRALLRARDASLRQQGVSSIAVPEEQLDEVPAPGERRTIPGRTNRSVGGTMMLEAPPSEETVFTLARRALEALGLRAGAVDLFAEVNGEHDATAIIEVNANPSIRMLEETGRTDLILRIWRHTFQAMGLLGV